MKSTFRHVAQKGIASTCTIALLALMTISNTATAATSSQYPTTSLPTTSISTSATNYLAMQFIVPDDSSITQDTLITDGSNSSSHGDALTAFPSTTKHVDNSGGTSNVYNSGEAIIEDLDNDNVFDANATSANVSSTETNGVTLTASAAGTASNGVNLILMDDDATDCTAETTASLAALILGTSPNFTLTCDLDDSLDANTNQVTGTLLVAAITDGTTTTIDATVSATATLTGADTLTDQTITLAGGTDADSVTLGSTPTDGTALVAFTSTEKFVDAGTAGYDSDDDIYNASDTVKTTLNKEELNAITITNLGTATLGAANDVTSMNFCYEENLAENIFSGNETCKTMTLTGSTFVLSGENISLKDGKGIKSYVTINTSGTIADGKTIQLSIPVLSDGGTINMFDSGDMGIFLSTNDNGPTNLSVNGSVITSGLLGVISSLESSAKDIIDTVEDISNGDEDDFDDFRDDIEDAVDDIKDLNTVLNNPTEDVLDDLAEELVDLFEELDSIISSELGSSLSEDDFDDLYSSLNDFVRNDFDNLMIAMKDTINNTNPALLDQYNEDLEDDIMDEVDALESTVRNMRNLQKFTKDQVETDLDSLLDEVEEAATRTGAASANINELDFFFQDLMAVINDVEDTLSRSTASYDADDYDDINDIFYDIDNILDNMFDTLDASTLGGSIEDDFEDYKDDTNSILNSAEAKLIALMPSDYSQIDNVNAALTDVRGDMKDLGDASNTVSTDDDIQDYFEDLIEYIEDGKLEVSKINDTVDEDDYEDLQDKVKDILDEILNTINDLDELITTPNLQEDFNAELPEVWTATNNFLSMAKDERPNDSALVFMDMENEFAWFEARAKSIENNANDEVILDEDEFNDYSDMMIQLIEDMHISLNNITCAVGDNDEEFDNAIDEFDNAKSAIEDILSTLEDANYDTNDWDDDDEYDDDFDALKNDIQGSSTDSNSANTLEALQNRTDDIEDITGCESTTNTNTTDSSNDNSTVDIDSITFEDMDTLYVTFSGSMNEASVENTSNYTITDKNSKNTITDNISISSATYHAEDNNVVVTVSGMTSQLGETYQVTVTNAKDANSKNIIASNSTLSVIQPSFSEVKTVTVGTTKTSLKAGSTDFSTITALANDVDGNALQNIDLQFEVVSGGGELSIVGSGMTNQNGEVQAIYTPGKNSGVVLIKASSVNDNTIYGTTNITIESTANNETPANPISFDNPDFEVGGGKTFTILFSDETNVKEGSETELTMTQPGGVISSAIVQKLTATVENNKATFVIGKVFLLKPGKSYTSTVEYVNKNGETKLISVPNINLIAAEKAVTPAPVVAPEPIVEEPEPVGKVLGANITTPPAVPQTGGAPLLIFMASTGIAALLERKFKTK